MELPYLPRLPPKLPAAAALSLSESVLAIRCGRKEEPPRGRVQVVSVVAEMRTNLAAGLEIGRAHV